ncbi:hypothetical protein GCM10009000_104480 [Halobacterium noricense]
MTESKYNEDGTVSKQKVGSNFKAEGACALYEPHTMDDDLFEFLQGIEYEVVATGCGSCGGSEADLTYTQQHDHAGKIYLNYSDIEIAQEVAEQAEDAGLTVDWDGTEIEAVGIEA